MKIIKINLSEIKKDVFFQYIYPLYCREFMFGSNYESFAFLIEANFILNPQQWEYILEHWEFLKSNSTIENVL